MRIRKLELQGFKSFADRATLHFGPGISCVVGPNGCGKSNIMDAVRWCIGEQSARSLRGESMSDIIFAGSAARKGLGFAEVGLTFVAGDEPFPGIWQRFPELEVSRRLFRDGASEYRVNEEKVRLRDIADLFLDTGVGNRLYSFIEQGRIGQIVHARPQERRSLIEEAAGISRYKARREESLEKLGHTREALDKVADLHDDLGRQLKAAERQVQRALRAQHLRARWRQEGLLVGLARFGGLAADRKVLGERLRAANAELEEAGRAVARHEQDLDRRRALHEVAEAEAGRVRDRLNEVEAQRRVEDSAQQFQEREHVKETSRLAQLERDQEDQRRERDHAAAEAAAAGAAVTAAESELARVRSEADGAQQELQQRHVEASGVRERLDRARRAAHTALEGAVRTRGQQAGLQARRQELDGRTERHRRAVGELGPSRAAEELVRLRATAAEADRRVIAARHVVDAAVVDGRARVEAGRAEAGALAMFRSMAVAAERAAEVGLTETTRRRAALGARWDALAGMEAAHADLPDGVKAALTMPGVLGLLGERLSMSEALEGPTSRALDGALDAVLVPDAATAMMVAEAAGASRLRVLALDRVPAGRAADGALTGLAAVLARDDDTRAALAALLPDAEVVADLAAAYARWVPGRTLVTRGGAVLRADGLLVLGAESGAALASVRRRREMDEVATRQEQVPVAAAEAALAAATAELRGAEATILTHQAALEALARSEAEALEASRAEARRLDQLAGELRHRVREVEAEALRQARAAETLVQEAAALATLEAALAVDRVRLDAERAVAEGIQGDAEAALRAEQVELERVEPLLAAASERAQTLRLSAASLQSTALQQAQLALAARARTERAQRRVEQIAQERTDTEARLLQLALDQDATRATVGRLGEEEGAIATELERVRLAAGEAKETVRIEDLATRASRERRDGSRDRQVAAELAWQQVKHAVETLLKATEEQNGLSLPSLLDRIDRDGALLVPGWEPTAAELDLGAELVPTLRLDNRALDLDEEQLRERHLAAEARREALFKLGETNPDSIPEYHAVRTVFDDIDRQRADLQTALEVIESAIARINQTCRERFRETYEAVTEHFAALYPRLVGGGSARLELTDAEDLLNCGVEMLVQPPGKKVQVLSLLSGGEKAMAAIGLIFALFRVKPSPFCLLDEVDAPLDEGNGARFNEMLREMASASQFIVITHNKKTMECADVLYGVTMPEPGQSRLVSVRLEGG
ncbi:MAG: chromosome segregation protein SMC [Myxococcales bacterium]|nr:chromosome segregation protein SMC [Myxococcales bacterium]